MDFFYGLILKKMLVACFQYFSLLYMVWYLVYTHSSYPK